MMSNQLSLQNKRSPRIIWSEKQKLLLKKLTQEWSDSEGKICWKDVLREHNSSVQSPKRTIRQCRSKYNEYLKPELLKEKEWTQQDDDLILSIKSRGQIVSDHQNFKDISKNELKNRMSTINRSIINWIQKFAAKNFIKKNKIRQNAINTLLKSSDKSQNQRYLMLFQFIRKLKGMKNYKKIQNAVKSSNEKTQIIYQVYSKLVKINQDLSNLKNIKQNGDWNHNEDKNINVQVSVSQYVSQYECNGFDTLKNNKEQNYQLSSSKTCDTIIPSTTVENDTNFKSQILIDTENHVFLIQDEGVQQLSKDGNYSFVFNDLYYEYD